MNYYAYKQKILAKEKQAKDGKTYPKVLFEGEDGQRETLLVYNDTIYNFLEVNTIYDLTCVRTQKGYIEIKEVKEVIKWV